MSYDPSSRDHQTHEITLADVIAALPAAGLLEGRRREISSALRTVARGLDRPPERIPAEPRQLSARLKEIAPHALGISPRRWNNIRSLTRAGLALVLPMSPGRNTNALSPSWDALSSQLQSPWVRTPLSRLMRFCSGTGIEPTAVSEVTFAEFRAHLDNTLKDPDAVFRANAGHSKHTNRGLVINYGRWLTFLHRCGQLDRTGSPADRITPARVRAYVADLERYNATHTILTRLGDLLAAARVDGATSRLDLD
jgi:hypothetical protein